MNKTPVEIQYPKSVKVFVCIVSLPFSVMGVICWASPFIHVFYGVQPTIFEAMLVGAGYLCLGFCFWWPVASFSIRADKKGISQSKGFRRQTVLWLDVAYYYMEEEDRVRKLKPHYEPVLFNTQGKIIFRAFGYHQNLEQKRLDQRSELWGFVEEQLQGKKIDAPPFKPTPAALAWKSVEVNWAQKSKLWIIGRLIALIMYAIFWLCIVIIPLFYFLLYNPTSHTFYYPIIVMLSIFVPLVPHLIWLQFKKRKIAKELKMQDANK